MVELLQGVTQTNVVITATVSEPEANERASYPIGISSKRKGLWSKAQGIVVMCELRN